ncbi:MAG: glycerophosphodiester phosphodiesterase [Acidimicrobiales bacterium]
MGRPRVVAHRGASRAFPENTVEAFRGAVTLGADGIELDVRRCADGTLAVHHDPTPADGGPPLAERTAETLPAEVPTLATALAASEPLWVNVEIKSDPAEPGFDPAYAVAGEVAAVLAAAGAPERFLVSSFDPGAIAAHRAVDPSIPTGLLVFHLADLARTVARAAEAGHVALHPFDPLVDAALVDAAHAAGLAVNVWTVDDPARMVELAALGVDAIITNVPDLARAALDAPPAAG